MHEYGITIFSIFRCFISKGIEVGIGQLSVSWLKDCRRIARSYWF